LLAFFPFLIFLVTLLGFLGLAPHRGWLNILEGMLPTDAALTVAAFVEGIAQPPRGAAGLLSGSLLMAVFSASNGFRAVVRGVNKSHGTDDRRNPLQKHMLYVVLMLVFAFSLLVMLVLWAFSGILAAWMGLTPPLYGLIRGLGWGASWLVLLCAVAYMYHLACAQPKNQRRRLWPGAVVTVALWGVSSFALGVFVSRFSNIGAVYGSIAGIFVLIVWLNLVSFFLLLGNSVNAIMEAK